MGHSTGNGKVGAMASRLRRSGVLAVAVIAGTSLLHVTSSGAAARRAARPSVSAPLPAPSPEPQSVPPAAATPAASPSSAPALTVESRVSDGVWAVRMNAPGTSRPALDGFVRAWGRSVNPGAFRVATVRLKVGAAPRAVYLTDATTVASLLAALNVGLGPSDLVRPRLGSRIGTRGRVTVVRVHTGTMVEIVPLLFGTTYEYSPSLTPGTQRVMAHGQMGRARERFVVTYRNGRVVSRAMVSETVLVAPVAEVVLRGPGVGIVNGAMTGQASWYDLCTGMTAASRTLPFGTVVTVTNLDNGRSVRVVIDDRGPWGVPGRIIDLCQPAFAQIAPLSQGVANVRLTW